MADLEKENVDCSDNMNVDIDGFTISLNPNVSPPTAEHLFHAMFFHSELPKAPIHQRQQRWNKRRIQKRWSWKRGRDRKIYEKRAAFLKNLWNEMNKDYKAKNDKKEIIKQTNDERDNLLFGGMKNKKKKKTKKKKKKRKKIKMKLVDFENQIIEKNKTKKNKNFAEIQAEQIIAEKVFLFNRRKTINQISSTLFCCIPCCIQASNTLLIESVFFNRNRCKNKKIDAVILPISDKQCEQLLLIHFENTKCALSFYQNMTQQNNKNERIQFVEQWFGRLYFLQHCNLNKRDNARKSNKNHQINGKYVDAIKQPAMQKNESFDANKQILDDLSVVLFVKKLWNITV